MSKENGKKKKYYLREAKRRTKEGAKDFRGFEMRPRDPYKILKLKKSTK